MVPVPVAIVASFDLLRLVVEGRLRARAGVPELALIALGLVASTDTRNWIRGV